MGEKWTPFYEDKAMREAGPPTTYDWTLLSQFVGCARKFYWFYRGLDYVSIPAYFTFGKAWQATLDAWYTNQTVDGMSPTEIFTKGEEALESGRRVWLEDNPVQNPPNDWATHQELFKYYIGNFPVEPFKVIGAEKGWIWPLAGTPYSLGGSLDDYILWEPFGFCVMENKTTGTYLTDQYIEGWSFSNQVTGYIWFLTQFKGEEIFGCLMNMATKRIPKKKTPEHLFGRNLEKRDEFDFEKYEEKVRIIIADIEREWDRWVWPTSANQIECVGGIGKSPCLFKALCKTKLDIQDIQPLGYRGLKWREEEWKPWERG